MDVTKTELLKAKFLMVDLRDALADLTREEAESIYRMMAEEINACSNELVVKRRGL